MGMVKGKECTALVVVWTLQAGCSLSECTGELPLTTGLLSPRVLTTYSGDQGRACAAQGQVRSAQRRPGPRDKLRAARLTGTSSNLSVEKRTCLGEGQEQSGSVERSLHFTDNIRIISPCVVTRQQSLRCRDKVIINLISNGPLLLQRAR